MQSEAISKNNIDDYFRALGKEFRKRNGKVMPAEIIITGGAALIIKYGFRGTTQDIDAILHASSAMHEAILSVADKYDLPPDWLNSDFTKTSSYSDKLMLHSKHYKTFSNIVDVRIVEDEYLIATKLRASRIYRHDLSDIIGIFLERSEIGQPLNTEDIKNAFTELYGDLPIPQKGMEILNAINNSEDLEVLYEKVNAEEKTNNRILKDFEKEYPGILNDDNIETISNDFKIHLSKKTFNQRHNKLPDYDIVNEDNIYIISNGEFSFEYDSFNSETGNYKINGYSVKMFDIATRYPEYLKDITSVANICNDKQKQINHEQER